MDDFAVDRGAKYRGEAVVALESGDGVEGFHLGCSDFLEVHGGSAGDDHRADSLMHLTERVAGTAHLFDLGGGFDEDSH